MIRRQVQWYRIFAIYFCITAASLLVGAFVRPPMHDILLMLGACMAGIFVPLVMVIYFWRGLRGNQ